jgi:3-oxoacyl-[acyl-carrier-protein] synthase-3
MTVWRSSGAVAVLGTGLALPGTPVATAALLDALGSCLDKRGRATAAAIAARMGIETRHVGRPWHARAEGPAPGCSNPDLAAAAVRAALADAGLRASDLGYLIGHTATPAQPLPGNIVFAADQLGYPGPHIELRQACTGFANALMIAFGLLARPGARPVAIVGSETGSVFLDPDRLTDRPDQLVNLVQMGDGAGAIVLGPAGSGRDNLHGAWFGAAGLDRSPGLLMRAGGSAAPSGGDGPLLFDHDFAAIIRHGAALFEAGMQASPELRAEDADWLIPHQVSGRIGRQLARRFGLPAERFFVNADRVGNTGSAAIWIALAELRAGLRTTTSKSAANCPSIVMVGEGGPSTSYTAGSTQDVHGAPARTITKRPGVPRGSRTLVLGAEATKYMHGGFCYVAG